MRACACVRVRACVRACVGETGAPCNVGHHTHLLYNSHIGC